MLAANKLGALSVLLADRVEAALGDVSPSAAALLLTLRCNGTMTASALAPILGVAQPTAARVAQGLARRGLIAARGREGRIDTLLGEAAVERAQARRICRLCDHDICAGRLCPVGSRASAIERAEAPGKSG
jgi:hypothetical protein